MKKSLLLFLAVVLLSVFPAGAADAVDPASVALTNTRSEAVSSITSEVFYQDSTLLFTNCLAYSDSAGTTTQGLVDVTVTIDVGNIATNISYTATVYGTGTLTNHWWVSITVPSFITGTVSVQTKLTDATAATNIFIYPWRTISHKEAL